jgi:hypothetical protein
VLLSIFGLAAALAGAYLKTTSSHLPSTIPPLAPAVSPHPPSAQPVNVVLPRRFLAIAVNNYLYANPVNDASPGRNIHTLVERMARVLRVPTSQTIELSDTSPPEKLKEEDRGKSTPTRRASEGSSPPVASPSRPTLPCKRVVEQTVKAFLQTCRTQDRILVLLIGHIVEIGEEAFLVPFEGDLTVKETLIPLSWLYEQLATCKARQKVLILDTCRLDPGRGWERPGSGPMTTSVDQLLQKPPAGVRIWSACTSGQYSYESNGSGVFLEKLYDALTDSVLKKTPEPQDALPIEDLAKVVDQRTAAEVASQVIWLNGQKAVQTPRLTGQMNEQGAAYDQDEPLPTVLDVPAPSLPGGMAREGQILQILREIDLPPIKVHSQHSPLQLVAMLPFSAAVINRYRPDSHSLADIEQHPDKYPLRMEAVKTIRLLRATFRPQGPQASFLEYLQGGNSERLKARIFKEQMKPARILGGFMERLEELRKAGERRDKEPSLRWQAHYDYLLAQLLARTAYVSEYDLMLGKIRKDELPELQPKIHKGWRLASSEKMASGKDVKEMAAQAKKLFAKIIQEHPGTPWEVLAKRARLTALGLEWRPSS